MRQNRHLFEGREGVLGNSLAFKGNPFRVRHPGLHSCGQYSYSPFIESGTRVYIVMANIVMALSLSPAPGLHSYGQYSYGPLTESGG